MPKVKIILSDKHLQSHRIFISDSRKSWQQSLLFLAGAAGKASRTDAQFDAAGSVLWGLGNFPSKQKIAFVSRKKTLAEE